ncbi:MAG TPA: hypothetical protein VGO53_08560, partial [Steroidobacteraceae bacterium]|nr:hypothetical protein [Steroidobacteraceae bacterium]
PARETPRPQDLEPKVDTSAPSVTEPTPVREAPRPQDLNPAVDTSATPSAGASPSVSPSARKPPAGAAGSTGTPAAAPAAPGSTPSASGAQPGGAMRSAPGKGKAQDRLDLDTTQITGNRELPKVLYIVPWKRADLGDLVGKPVNSLLDEVLAPVDRDVFKRENRYYRALNSESTQPASGPAAPPSTTAPNGAAASGSATPAARDER